MSGRLWTRVWEQLNVWMRREDPVGVTDPRDLDLRQQGTALLQQMLGARASFREGQWEAIEAIVAQRERVLVVQRTGWGKSLVYFLAARLLQAQGGGPTLLVSPLLSLMRNQVEMARRSGVQAHTIHSENRGEWAAAEKALAEDRCDVLLVSPERLAVGGFLFRTLAMIQGRVGLLAVDEAHCISDWGHDFRPDYRRLPQVLRQLPPETPVLATTATANHRVLADLEEQLGPGLRVFRGPLARASLSMHVVEPASEAERLAWLADQVPGLPGSGIIYCQTVADCRRVSDWLLTRGIAAPPYYSALDEYRPERETLLLENRVKALVATVALGMGFDKPDLGWVIHFQRPGSVVAYYQQVGRAGRALMEAPVILLQGDDDDEIHHHFIRTAFPEPSDLQEVMEALCTAPGGLREEELLERMNIAMGSLERILKRLQVEGAIGWDRGRFCRTGRPWNPDPDRDRRVTEQRLHELVRMGEYARHRGCLMAFLARELDDVDVVECGRCANCTGNRLTAEAPAALIQEAIQFLKVEDRLIEPRRQWPAVGLAGREGVITHPNEPGRSLCLYGDDGWGRVVREGKYRVGAYSDRLVDACVELVRERWRPSPAPEWVTAVPSLRRPDLVPQFADRLAQSLGLPFHPVLAQVWAIPEQKVMRNSLQQARNVSEAFQVVAACPSGPVLLIDDVVDSRWTLTVAGCLIREAGGGPVLPLALAEAALGSGAA
jgi:ATP-dependent DNA helicase RecQ